MFVENSEHFQNGETDEIAVSADAAQIYPPRDPKILAPDDNYDLTYGSQAFEEDSIHKATKEGVEYINDASVSDVEEEEPIASKLDLTPGTGGKLDALSLFLEEVSKIPHLTREQERELAERVEKGDSEAKERLFEANLFEVVDYSKRYKGMGLDQLDLIQEGCIGLLKAIEKFDSQRGFRLISFAKWKIKGQMLKALIDKSRNIRLPKDMYENFTKVEKASMRLMNLLGREPTYTEVAVVSGLGVNEVAAAIKASITTRTIPFDQPLRGKDGSSADLKDILPDTSDNNMERAVERIVASTSLKTIMVTTLSPTEQKVLNERYALEGRKNPQSLKAVARALNKGVAEIRQIEKAATEKLKNADYGFSEAA